MALSLAVRDRLVARWSTTQRTYYEEDCKRAYYLSAEYLLLTGTVPPGTAGTAVGLATAVDGISGSAASAVTTALLTTGLLRAGAVLLPSAGDYAHAWGFGAAVAAVGALAVAAVAYTERTRAREHSARDAPARTSPGGA